MKPRVLLSNAARRRSRSSDFQILASAYRRVFSLDVARRRGDRQPLAVQCAASELKILRSLICKITFLICLTLLRKVRERSPRSRRLPRVPSHSSVAACGRARRCRLQGCRHIGSCSSRSDPHPCIAPTAGTDRADARRREWSGAAGPIRLEEHPQLARPCCLPEQDWQVLEV